MATGDLGNWLWPCEYVEEITGRPKGEVPHFLPGKNPFLKQFPQRWGYRKKPLAASPKSCTPEYQKKI